MRRHAGVMQAADMRSLSREARHERRVQVTRLREAGHTYQDRAGDQVALPERLDGQGVARHRAIPGRRLRSPSVKTTLRAQALPSA